MVAHFYQAPKQGEFVVSRFLVPHTFCLVDHDLQTLEFVHNVEENQVLSGGALRPNTAINRDILHLVMLSSIERLYELGYSVPLASVLQARMAFRIKRVLALLLLPQHSSTLLLKGRQLLGTLLRSPLRVVSTDRRGREGPPESDTLRTPFSPRHGATSAYDVGTSNESRCSRRKRLY